MVTTGSFIERQPALHRPAYLSFVAHDVVVPVTVAAPIQPTSDLACKTSQLYGHRTHSYPDKRTLGEEAALGCFAEVDDAKDVGDGAPVDKAGVIGGHQVWLAWGACT